MEISTKQLREQPGRVIAMVNNGQSITVTYRGEPSVKIVPFEKREVINIEESENELFGMWKDRKDMQNVDQYVRTMRKGRKM